MGVGGTKKWERLESYGSKFVENIVQGTARDILCDAMQTLKNCSIVAHAVSYTHLDVYKRQVQYLLPICLTYMEQPDIAMTLTIMDGYYFCLLYTSRPTVRLKPRKNQPECAL